MLANGQQLECTGGSQLKPPRKTTTASESHPAPPTMVPMVHTGTWGHTTLKNDGQTRTMTILREYDQSISRQIEHLHRYLARLCSCGVNNADLVKREQSVVYQAIWDRKLCLCGRRTRPRMGRLHSPSPLARFTMCTVLELAHPPFWTDLRSD